MRPINDKAGLVRSVVQMQRKGGVQKVQLHWARADPKMCVLALIKKKNNIYVIFFL